MKWGTLLRTTRSAVRLTGPDVFKLLQGLTCNDCTPLFPSTASSSSSSLPSSGSFRGALSINLPFLNSKGRILFDTIGTQTEDGVIIDCQRSQFEDLTRHFKKYKLRSKVTLDDYSDTHTVCVVLAPSIADVPEQYRHRACVDPRSPSLGFRVIVPSDGFSAGSETETEEVYRLHQLVHGIAEGKELLGDRLPLESNLDVHNGVCYTKGCYLGQELTARTHFTGVVRKRFFPVSVAPDDTEGCVPLTASDKATVETYEAITKVSLGKCAMPAVGSRVLTPSGKAAGIVSATLGPVGLALLRLEHLAESRVDDGQTSLVVAADGTRLHVTLPPWYPGMLATLRERTASVGP